MRVVVAALQACVLACLVSVSVHADGAGSPGEDVYKLPDRAQRFLVRMFQNERYGPPQLSPDGRRIAYLERQGMGSGAIRVAVIDLDAPGGPQTYATRFSDVEPTWVGWGGNERLVIAVAVPIEFRGYARHVFRNSDYHGLRMVSVDPEFATPPVPLFSNVSQRTNWNNIFLHRITDILPGDPDHILMPAYRGDHYHLWRVNLNNGEAEIIERGDRNTVDWFTSNGVAVLRYDRTGSRLNVHSRQSADEPWRRTYSLRISEFQSIGHDFQWAGATRIPGQIYVRARPEGQSLISIYRYDLATGQFVERIAGHDRFDVNDAVVDPWTGQYTAFRYTDDRHRYEFADAATGQRYDQVLDHFGPQMEVEPISFGGDRMIVRATGPQNLGAYYLLDPDRSEIASLFSIHGTSIRSMTSPVEPVGYTARDGLDIPAYLTLPPGGMGPDVPLIVYPHGGPEARDRIAHDRMAQFLAALGYVVLQPNFRGSIGYGGDFTHAGYREWGRAMQNDLSDGVEVLVSEGLVDPERICIVGFSYGGYAALAGAALTPDLYSCAIAGGAVTDLPAFLDHKERQNEDHYAYWVEQIGDQDNDTERSAMLAVSPRHQASRIRIPVLLLHGEEDRIVPVDQSQRMARALERHGVPHVYVEEPAGVHYWGRNWENTRLTFRNVAAFLDDALDGRLDTFEAEYPEEPEED